MREQPFKQISLWALTTAIVLLIAASSAVADTYPVSGKWTYDNPRADGPAKECGTRYMSFEGNQRRDTAGSVRAFRNFSVVENGDTYNIVDQFDSGQILARQIYTLRKIDGDHIELNLSPGPTIPLRRCE